MTLNKYVKKIALKLLLTHTFVYIHVNIHINIQIHIFQLINIFVDAIKNAWKIK